MCTWSPSQLAEPLESWQLSPPPDVTPAHPISAMCVSFPDNNVDDFLVGGEDGDVWRGSRIGGGAGAHKGGVRMRMQGHVAPVTGLHVHPSSQPPRRDLSHLVSPLHLDERRLGALVGGRTGRRSHAFSAPVLHIHSRMPPCPGRSGQIHPHSGLPRA